MLSGYTKQQFGQKFFFVCFRRVHTTIWKQSVQENIWAYDTWSEQFI